MKRNIINDLIRWKTEDNNKPILLTGLKGVGKTYLAYDFAKAFFEFISYINLEHDRVFIKLTDCKNPALFRERLVDWLHLDTSLPASSRILILDEIGDCDKALDMISSCDLSDLFKYIILISSKQLLHKPENITELPVHPLGFDEFLIASGNDWYIEAIVNHFNSNKKIPDIVHKELLELNQLYLQTGGMPQAINEYLNIGSLINVQETHSFLIGLYRDYISRSNSDSDALKMLQVYDSLASQLAKENKKFQYRLIRKGTTHSMYKEAIQSLCDNRFVIRCSRIGSEELKNPELAKLDEWQRLDTNSSFKLYYSDCGLCNTQIKRKYGHTLDKPQTKAILENYLASSLAAKNYSFAFWESEAMARMDFICMKEDSILPIEIFDGENTRSKNISVLKQKSSFPYAIKISSRNFEFSNQIKYVPYYAVFCL